MTDSGAGGTATVWLGWLNRFEERADGVDCVTELARSSADGQRIKNKIVSHVVNLLRYFFTLSSSSSKLDFKK